MVAARFLSPKDFEVNEAWIVLRANKQSFRVEASLYDCYVLMDAGSAYVFGHVLVPEDGEPGADEVEQLLQDAWRMKRRWAQRLIVTEKGRTEDVFMEKAQDHGLTIESIPANILLPIVGPMRESFAELGSKPDA